MAYIKARGRGERETPGVDRTGSVRVLYEWGKEMHAHGWLYSDTDGGSWLAIDG